MKTALIGTVALCAGLVFSHTAKAQDEFSRQWGLQAINAGGAWQSLNEAGYPMGGDGVIVAIVDDGVHPGIGELAGRVLQGPLNTVTGTHGSSIAGVIAAAYDNRGMIGVAFNAQLLAADDNNPDTIAVAAQQGARVVSMSFAEGEAPKVEALRQGIYGAASYDAVMVASLGQDDEPGHGWPVGFASDPEVDGRMIVVGSVDENMNLVSFPCGSRSQAQPNYCLVAPGENVVGTVPPGFSEDGAYSAEGVTLSMNEGTSFAVPFVSGAAAVLRAVRPDLSAREIVDILLDSATPLHAPGEDASSVSPTYGYGLLNLEAAVQIALQ